MMIELTNLLIEFGMKMNMIDGVIYFVMVIE
jgi:hypothetical protein